MRSSEHTTWGEMVRPSDCRQLERGGVETSSSEGPIQKTKASKIKPHSRLRWGTAASVFPPQRMHPCILARCLRFGNLCVCCLWIFWWTTEKVFFTSL